MKTTKKRNPQSAANKKFAKLEDQIRDLQYQVNQIKKQLRAATIVVSKPVLD